MSGSRHVWTRPRHARKIFSDQPESEDGSFEDIVKQLDFGDDTDDSGNWRDLSGESSSNENISNENYAAPKPSMESGIDDKNGPTQVKAKMSGTFASVDVNMPKGMSKYIVKAKPFASNLVWGQNCSPSKATPGANLEKQLPSLVEESFQSLASTSTMPHSGQFTMPKEADSPMKHYASGDPGHRCLVSPSVSPYSPPSSVSPPVQSPTPRKGLSVGISASGSIYSHYPPNKKFKSLHLFDDPYTPKSLMEQAALNASGTAHGNSTVASNLHELACMDSKQNEQVKKFNPSNSASKPYGAGQPKFFLGSTPATKRTRKVFERDDEGEVVLAEASNMSVNRLPDSPIKRVHLRDYNSTSRLKEDFKTIQLIGSGQFGDVAKCVNKLDGCIYAIKKSRRPVSGGPFEQAALREVCAHAVLGQHNHVVRYYSAWAEKQHMLIQNEYCNGGNLADEITSRGIAEIYFTEKELRVLLLHVAQGLKYIHSKNMAHLDIKPGNIFIQRNEDDGFGDEEEELESGGTVYKIGDFGHMQLLKQDDNSPAIEEGDCRYLALEVLQENYMHLDKADVFSLGLTIVEAGGGGPLPQNGDEWQEIRKGFIPELAQCSPAFMDLLREMVNPDAKQRPTASSILHQPIMEPVGIKSKAQLRKELNAERFKNEMLSRKLQEAVDTAGALQRKSYHGHAMEYASAANSLPNYAKSRLIGRKMHRSLSVQNF